MMTIRSSDNRFIGSERWGAASLAGFQTVPDALLIKQRQLGLTPLDIVIILNITVFWWLRDEPPYLRSNIIANRVGVSPRTVQRTLRNLQKKGLIERGKWRDAEGKARPAVFFKGLTAKLEQLVEADAHLAGRLQRSRENSNRQHLYPSGDDILLE